MSQNRKMNNEILVLIIFLNEEHGDLVVDLSLNGRCLENHWMHCVVSLSKTLYSLLISSSTKEDRK